MSRLVSQKDQRQEIIFELCPNRLLKDEVSRGVTERARDTKHESQLWRERRYESLIGLILLTTPQLGFIFSPVTGNYHLISTMMIIKCMRETLSSVLTELQTHCRGRKLYSIHYIVQQFAQFG